MKNILMTVSIGVCVSMMSELTAMESLNQSAMIAIVSNHEMENLIKDTTITVYGNCSSCKKAIEKAAKSIDGVESATWDKKKKILAIQYDTAKTSLDLIEKAIIAIGYDTENLRAEDSVYDELHHCCKYDRKPQ